ncbi:3'-5' exonuclease [Natrinema salsiterrestre]|uniref:DNA 3'-5' helicase n=1 Tax=Natrinema salsiterrestre TaxID=2950540 RepID=A0A9Q4L6S6_9EURY|nr:3'-5' exonuclease [Natrinema salsiterrestre]MDF9748309.1 AAA family ATPase [Natrinema salsiterrestre]
MTDIPRFPIVGRDEVPVDESVKINGPPGTGKSSQGLCRVQVLDADHDYELPRELCWITYRRALAEDLIDRMAETEWDIIDDEEAQHPKSGDTELVATVHAACRRLQSDHFDGRETPNWQDYNDFMQSEYRVPYVVNSNSNEDRAALLFSVYKWLKHNQLEMINAEQCPMIEDLRRSWPSHPDLVEFERAWDGYKESNKLFNYFEYIERAIEHNITPGVPVLVFDEYHDVYPLLHELGQMWIDSAEIAIILGDPQQVVNLHDGASPEHYNKVDLPEIQLDTTHRVPPSLWDAAANVLHGYHTPHNPTFDCEDNEDAIEIVNAPRFRHNDATSEWSSPIGQYGTPDMLYEEYVGEDETLMYLTRARFEQEAIASGLKRTGIIFRAQKNTVGCWQYYDRRRHLYNVLKRLEGATPDDDLKLNGKEAVQLLNYARSETLDYDRSVVKAMATEWSRDGHTVHISKLNPLVNDTFWSHYTNGPVSVTMLAERQGEDALPRDVITNALSYNDEPTVGVEIGKEDHGLENTPILRTIHASKGAEADRVFVYDGITNRIASETRSNLKMSINEDRVWYVALTRAKEQTVVVRGAFPFMDEYLPAAGVMTE